MLVHMHGSHPARLPPSELKSPVHEEPGGEAGLGLRLGKGRDGNSVCHLGKLPVASPRAEVLPAPSGERKGVSGAGKVVSSSCRFFPSRSPCERRGCLEGSTSYFPLRPVQTTKPLSRSLTETFRERA